ncbi:MAG: Zn-dependent hydrolase [Bacteroidales bacterium]|nr:Zn-dependent hydrolase [Bacteroidales bacterium]
MFKKLIPLVMCLALSLAFSTSCKNGNNKDSNTTDSTAMNEMQSRVNEYATVKLTTDLNQLTDSERKMIPILLEAAAIMDDIFWEQTLGNKSAFLDTIADPTTRRFAEINYGPWDRLDGNKPFVSGFGEKPKGANFYPADMSKEEFEAFKDPNKSSMYTLLRRDASGKLSCIWFHDAYKEKTAKASELLLQASELAEDAGLKKYLKLRAKALLTDDYFESDMAWMDMKTNTLDIVVGPIENYEDELFGTKAAHESSVLVKDKEWSKKLEKYSAMLPALQKDLPCEPQYKKEVPGSSSDLNAYDILYYAGNSNSGGKTIAINLPNDEKVQLAKGSRRLQLKNAMRAKFDKILLPISTILIDPAQRQNIKFDAFFSNVMFHEVAHGLGIKNTITGKGTVREALKEQYSGWEEAKADILGLYLVTKLIEKGELTSITAEDAYVTYMAGLIRSVRFGAAEAHGKANMMCFNFFEDKGAFSVNADGTFKVDFEKTRLAMNEWSAFILKIEGDGDYAKAVEYIAANGLVRDELKKGIEKLQTANIPKDVVFEQGKTALGL